MEELEAAVLLGSSGFLLLFQVPRVIIVDKIALEVPTEVIMAWTIKLCSALDTVSDAEQNITEVVTIMMHEIMAFSLIFLWYLSLLLLLHSGARNKKKRTRLKKLSAANPT